MALKLKWIVDPAPTGRYRSFARRGWPTAEYPDGEQAARIECVDEYRPHQVKDGSHSELKVRIADYSGREKGFEWRTLKSRFSTLQSAKDGVYQFLSIHPEWHPKPKPIPKVLQFECVMEIDQGRSVIYIHSKDKGHTMLRICGLPEMIPDPSDYMDGLDITHMRGCSWKK